MQELLTIILQSSGWFFMLVLYIILGLIIGHRMSRIWGSRDDLRWLSIGISLSIFVAYPATFYLYYAMHP